MSYPVTGAEYGVTVGGAAVPFPVGFQPTDALVIGPEPFTGADGTVTYDGLDLLVLTWAGPWPPEWVAALTDIWEAATAAGGRAQVRYYSDRAGAFVEQTGVPLRPIYGARQGWWVYDLEWRVQGLGLV